MAMHRIVLFWLVALILTNSMSSTSDFQLFAEKMSKSSHNAARTTLVDQTLSQAAGVYKNKEKGKKMGVEKTVFTTVIAFNAAGIFHYKVYFQNFMCFARHYDFDVVVYVLHHHLEDVDAELSAISRMGVRALSYPDELFWRILATKPSPIIPGDNRANYKGNFPSFQNHGALVMLVPLMEVLEHGFNAIFFDVDIGLVQDPVPFLIKGDADFVTALEPRICPELYPSFMKKEFDWSTAEPNSGVMHLRSTPSGRRFFRTWLMEIVDENFINDQRAFRPWLLNGTYTPNCNWNVSAVTPFIRPQHASYCILSETLFQNGMIAFTCSSKKRFHDDWVLEMYEHGVPMDGRYYPVTVHANYCDAKTLELKRRGLWLLDHSSGSSDSEEGAETRHAGALSRSSSGGNSSQSDHGSNTSTSYVFSCRPFSTKKSSHFVGIEEVTQIKAKRADVMKEIMTNGTVIKPAGSDETYFIENGRKRWIPDIETFTALGLSWNYVVTIANSMVVQIPAGEPIPSKKHSLKKT